MANDAKGKGGERQFNGLIDVYAKTLKTDGIQVKFIFSKKATKIEKKIEINWPLVSVKSMVEISQIFVAFWKKTIIKTILWFWLFSAILFWPFFRAFDSSLDILWQIIGGKKSSNNFDTWGLKMTFFTDQQQFCKFFPPNLILATFWQFSTTFDPFLSGQVQIRFDFSFHNLWRIIGEEG